MEKGIRCAGAGRHVETRELANVLCGGFPYQLYNNAEWVLSLVFLFTIVAYFLTMLLLRKCYKKDNDQTKA